MARAEGDNKARIAALAGSPGRLFVFGLGYSAERLAHALQPAGWTVAGTRRSAQGVAEEVAQGVDAYRFDSDHPLADPQGTLAGATHVLCSIPPAEDGDPVVTAHAEDLKRIGSLRWVGYLSTTGVYGDAQGGWVDEDTEPNPGQERSKRRHAAELAWAETGLPVHVFRLAGIYGPGRSPLEQLRAGTARRIDKPGAVFGRIHVDDIAAAVAASMGRPDPQAAEKAAVGRPVVYNCADEMPAASAEVIEHAAKLLGVDPPPLVPYEEAELSPMAQSFYAENRRVASAKTQAALGHEWFYPSYHDGLAAVLAETTSKA